MMVLGRFSAPFGIKGWLKVQPFGDDPVSWTEMPEWWISSDADAPDEAWQTTRLLDFREHSNGLVVQIEQSPDRNTAEALKGWFFGAPREAMPKPDEDEFYWGDLIGLKVINLQDESLGTIESLLSTGAHDVLRVMEDKTERLIPFVAAYITEVDRDTGTVRVDWQKDW